MSAALKLQPPTDFAEFLDWEQRQDIRYEWDGVQPIAMVGGSFAHTEIATRVSDALRAGRRGGPCTVIRADMKVVTANASRARYPDLVVTCSPIGNNDTVVRDPVVIFEVLSESTAGIDLGIKVREYSALSSLRRYVVLSAEERLALIFTPANGFRGEEVRDALDLPELDMTIALAAIYEGLL